MSVFVDTSAVYALLDADDANHVAARQALEGLRDAELTTRLGNWTEEQIEAALRTGHRPDGTPLLPPMPWANTAQMTDKEMGALIAYLKSLPPVKHAKPASLPPGAQATGPVIVIPAPGAWDAPKGP